INSKFVKILEGENILTDGFWWALRVCEALFLFWNCPLKFVLLLLLLLLFESYWTYSNYLKIK
ncbi:MAG: hypothetical protein N7Q72_01665, partial [Spiroplasma sp. Tabriz.8]|nr:hypothetical protein [Spiroplasma sp. Tabriz.8]